MDEYSDRSMPIGLAMLLAQNDDAMRGFAMMGEKDKGELLARARALREKHEMQALVDGIAMRKFGHR